MVITAVAGTSFSALPVHLVFATNYRRGVLDSAILQCCQAAMRKACGDFGAELREFNGEDDREFAEITDDELATAIDGIRVIARVIPSTRSAWWTR